MILNDTYSIRTPQHIMRAMKYRDQIMNKNLMKMQLDERIFSSPIFVLDISKNNFQNTKCVYCTYNVNNLNCYYFLFETSFVIPFDHTIFS